MKVKISHILVDILGSKDYLKDNLGNIRTILVGLLGEEGLIERNVMVTLMVHEAFAMVGLPKKHEVEGKINLEEGLMAVFNRSNSKHPFAAPHNSVSWGSAQFSHGVLCEKVLNLEEDEEIKLEEDYIELTQELDDEYIERTLRSHGNLLLNFYCYVLCTVLKSQLDLGKDGPKCFDFLQFFSSLFESEEHSKKVFSQQNYLDYVEYFGQVKSSSEGQDEALSNQLQMLKDDICDLILGFIEDGKDLAEELLIQLIAHANQTVRSEAIKYLNCLYDETIWKIEIPTTTEVKLTGEKIIVKFTPSIDSTAYYISLNFPNGSKTDISWHRITENAEAGKEIVLDLGTFEKCGFYDYKIVRLNANNIENVQSHRFIVHNEFIKHANFHEIVVDLFKATKDLYTGALTSRGNLRKVRDHLNYFTERGIDALHVSGIHKRAHDDPYSIASRTKIEDCIGGEEEFKQTLAEMHGKEIKLIVDYFDRVGSVNISKKYRELLNNHIDEKNYFTVCHGTSGKSNFSYSNSSILNYRKKKAWDLLIGEAVEFVTKYNIDGLSLDNCDLWPSLKLIDYEEMYGIDADGQPKYTADEILSGHVIDSHKDLLLWGDCGECPNPILIKLMKTLWKHFPNLMVIGECWKEGSEKIVELSGVVPRSHAMVKNITEDILTRSAGKKANFDHFKYNDEFMKDSCKGSILLQSTFVHSSHSLMKSFHNSYLTILDTLFFHEVVPITMHEEIEGKDSETEMFIQYFRPDFREMHASYHHTKAKIPEETKILSEEEQELKHIEEQKSREQFSKNIVKRLKRARELRSEKISLRNGVNVALKCVNQFGDVKTVLAYARYTDSQVAIIISNFEDDNKAVWVDFTPLKTLMKKQFHNESTLIKLEYWDKEAETEYHLLNEFIFCPKKFTVDAHETVTLEVQVEENPETHHEIYIKARQKFMENLELVSKATHMEASNIYMKYIQNLGECYHIHCAEEYTFSEEDEDLKDFHDLISKDQNVLAIIQKIVEKNKMGPICFVTPELAPWFKIGGLAVMVDELATGFAKLGEDTYIIVPYFDKKKNTGEQIFLDPDGTYGIKYLKNISLNLGSIHETFGIHYGVIKNVKVYFIHQPFHFFEPYPGDNNEFKLKSCALFCKAALQVLCEFKIIPEVIITNDWFTAFTPGYARDQKHFGTAFSGTTFCHIFHNLDVTYEGRFYTSPGETMEHIHNLPNDWLIDPYWSDHIINPSRCALIASDQWSSVSKSYRDQILQVSPLKPLLNKFSHPFACSNGVDVKDRMKDLAAQLKKRGLKHMDHLDSKRFLMEKYLNTPEVDPDLCIFSFVGRITEQKGVDVICSVVEQFLYETNFKAAFIVGGPAAKGDPHGAHVNEACKYLKNKFPHNFHGDPESFFYDVPVLSLGSNYCLMPSRFEPGGIVQHEFFIAGTPAVVFATGGLKDSVTEYSYQTGKGNGFEFLNYSREDLLQALHRAYQAFENKDAYRRLRKNAFESAIDVANVSKEWCSEAYRIRGKVFVNKAKLLQDLEKSKKESIDEMLPHDTTHEEEKDEILREIDFNYKGKSTDKVYLVGSFNDWNKRENRMSYNHSTKNFHCSINVLSGTYTFKIFVNGQWVLDPKKSKVIDDNGEEVSVLEVQ
ncbi:unnamed protein product [Moneuplotes crassus]|uniref:Uncharacterized protein n=1 Tax=Euplotes crassus TaxID=5936 RepID=A0AAD1U4J3_EUPCR|nr:unnamed protein product [Moneuplotes crassus]